MKVWGKWTWVCGREMKRFALKVRGTQKVSSIDYCVLRGALRPSLFFGNQRVENQAHTQDADRFFRCSGRLVVMISLGC